MEDFTAPSFSLGLDLDFDSEPQTAPIEASPSQEVPETSNNASFETFQDDGDFQLPALDPGLQSEDPPPRLKRLKRGPATQLSRVFDKQPAPPYLGFDDDIEEFSSQEDPREVKHSARQNRSACSSSKFPLHGHRALMTQSTSKAKVHISAPVSNASTSANLDASSSKLMFPNLTISPLKRFQLLDSDSEDPSSSVDACEDAIKTKTSPIERQYKPTQVATWNQQKGVETSKVTVQDEDLWEGFCPQKNISISTPGLDEYCDEYFQSLKNNNSWQRMESDICLSSKSHMKSNSSKVNVFQRMEGDVCANSSRTDQKCSTSGKDECIRNLEDYFPPARDYQKKFPPAHRYFYHGDPRIRRLVRNRLCNFFPLGALNHRERMQPDAAVIDYMSQFGHKEGHQLQETGKTSLGGSKKKGRQNSKPSKAEEISQASGSWVNPRSNANNPRDAGKRRVHANGCSSGYWFTGQDGRKVYKNVI
uniref:Uncharacterized protein n=1 Tax=Nelumbo nucifera TaxID=4432 RepID=A0A822XP22_NELNU|nr:TPA_asm: hypothetical protein HUJ06_021968 [Nelumbo nucifera]